MAQEEVAALAALARARHAVDAEQKKTAVRQRAEQEERERALFMRQRQAQHEALAQRAEAEKRAAEVRRGMWACYYQQSGRGACCRLLQSAHSLHRASRHYRQ